MKFQKQFHHSKFAQGGTIQNPYDGYTGLVGEAGPEIFQIAQGKVSITPISQSQRSKVLDQQAGQGNNSRSSEVDMNEIKQLLKGILEVSQAGHVVQMDGREMGRAAYPEIDRRFVQDWQRSRAMNMNRP